MENLENIPIQIIKMKKVFKIALVGLGQVGCYLLNELNTKKKILKLKLEKKYKLQQFQQEIKTKKEILKQIKVYFIQTL